MKVIIRSDIFLGSINQLEFSRYIQILSYRVISGRDEK